jgi:small subunit ribosomal protein S12
MVTFNQMIRGQRARKKHYFMCKALQKCPQKKGVCVKVYTTKPKKPNSATRKVAKVKLSNGIFVLAYVSGQGHNLQQHSTVMVRGGRVKDFPGVHYHLNRGKYDFSAKESFYRAARRSKFGIDSKQIRIDQ